MKKIALIIFDYFEYGGVQKDLNALGGSLRQLAAERKMDVELTLLCMHNRDNTIPAWCDHVKTLTPPWYICSNCRRAKWFDRQVERLKQEQYFDLLVGFNRVGNLDFYFAGDDCVKARYEKRPLAAMTSRGRIFMELERRVFSPPEQAGAGKIFTITRNQQQEFLRCYPECKIEQMVMMPPNLSAEFLDFGNYEELRRTTRESFNISGDETVIIQIAAAFHTKGVDRSLQLLGKAKSSGELEKFKFLVVGGTSLRVINAMKARAAGAGLTEDEVIFTGPRQDVRALLCGADLMIHPARAEATGGVLIEALSSGVPALSSEICGYNCFLEDAGAGVFIPEPFDAEEAQECLTDTLRRLPQLQTAAINYARTCITPEKFQRSLLEAEMILDALNPIPQA